MMNPTPEQTPSQQNTIEQSGAVYYDNNPKFSDTNTTANNTKTNLSSCCRIFLLLLSLTLFGIVMILYGVVNSISVSYVHQKCCNVTGISCNDSNCIYMINFPRLGSAKLLQDPKKGFGLTCSAEEGGNGILATSSIKKYSVNSFDHNLPRIATNIDCYTDKNENYVSLEPY